MIRDFLVRPANHLLLGYLAVAAFCAFFVDTTFGVGMLGIAVGWTSKEVSLL